MDPIRIGIATQTPLLRFASTRRTVPVASPQAGQVLVSRFEQGVDYEYTPGGVCRMVLPTLESWANRGWLREAHWLSLQPSGPPLVSLDGIPVRLHHLRLAPKELAAYARTKEKLWADIHGLHAPPFDREDFRFYSRYNWFTYDTLMEVAPDLDLAYVHDFQLLQVGALVGIAAPSVLRWHVPFDPKRIPPYTRNFLVRAMEDFDAVVVSTRRDLEGIANTRFTGKVRQLYPHIDAAALPDPKPGDVQALEGQYGIGPDDPVILCVARMDPMKRQDLAIRALARLRGKYPNAHLLLAGNGSFSGATDGGLSLSKPRDWARSLQDLVRELGVGDRVHFMHFLAPNALAAAFGRCQVAVLASDIEGFGLTTLEGWRYGRTTVVSNGTGVAEVVTPNLNGLVFRAGDDEQLAARLDAVLSDTEFEIALGKAAKASLRQFDVKKAAPREAEVLEDAIRDFGEG